MKLIINTDGGARGNPGPAAIGVVIERGGKPIAQFGKYIGERTNNVAEYSAVIEALRHVRSSVQAQAKIESITFLLDSKLVVNQLNGTFKVKDSNLRSLLMQIRLLEREVGGQVQYNLIPRAQNQQADFFVNQALDRVLMSH